MVLGHVLPQVAVGTLKLKEPLVVTSRVLMHLSVGNLMCCVTN